MACPDGDLREQGDGAVGDVRKGKQSGKGLRQEFALHSLSKDSI